jgi:hypothetical protein
MSTSCTLGSIIFHLSIFLAFKDFNANVSKNRDNKNS